jgi:hypothetical protein
MDEYDVVIIGAGIAGLYAAYKIRTAIGSASVPDPDTRILVLERTNKRQLGGRAGTISFQGTNVVTGAGIGRKHKDKLLLKLMTDLGLPINEFTTEHHFPPNIASTCDVKKTFLMLRREYKAQSEIQRGATFKEFAKPILGDGPYKQFVTCVGYSDYENEDVYDTLYNYGFDDNYQPWVGFSVPWKTLVDALVARIGIQHISPNSNVQSVYMDDDNQNQKSRIHVLFEKNNRLVDIHTRKLVIATDIDSALELIPGAKSKHSLYKHIKGQPFLRLYGKFTRGSIPVLKKYISGLTVVPGPLQKIIPMNPDKGVYMISYSDNQRTLALLKYLENTVENRDKMCRLLEKSLGIPKEECILEMTDMMECYWRVGTHYYQPLGAPFTTRQEFIKQVQHPHPNMVVVGEMVALNQGWVEGALDSVERVIQV